MTIPWGLGERSVSRLFRIVGRLKFVRHLYDFLMYGGRQSRAETIASTAKVVRDLEETKLLQTKRLNELAKMMKAAGFSTEDIQKAIRNEDVLEGVSNALDSLLLYVERGQIKISMVAQSDITDRSVALNPNCQKTGEQKLPEQNQTDQVH